MMYDCLIIGGGPAGISASIYLSRLGIKHLMFYDLFGGQMYTSGLIDNYPGISNTFGSSLTLQMKEHLKNLNPDICDKKIININKCSDIFVVENEDKEIFHAKTVILCTGANYKKLDIDGEDTMLNRGVSYCATCDGFLFRNQKVCVIGGGNSALDAALLLSNITKDITVINKNAFFKGERRMFEECTKRNIKFFFNTQTTEILGSKQVEGIVVQNIHGKSIIECSGVFIKIGMIPSSELVCKFNILNEYNEIEIDVNNRTRITGLFAAGDVTNISAKQIVIASGEGAKAAIEVSKFLQLEIN